jgi:ABC-type glycerol-3-phosphate transport system substrate-binding protein
MSNFQTILVAVFMAFFVFAVLIFSGLLKIGGSSNSSSTPQGKIVIWGTFNNTTELTNAFEGINTTNKDLLVSYVKKSESTYAASLIEAFASGNGPDLFFITPDMIGKFSNYIYKIPFASYAEKTFKDGFIDGASTYFDSTGVIGFPVIVDPMVLYYNRDMLSSEGIVAPPEYWNELFALNSKLTKKMNDGTINESMIALGRYDNITHSKDILATLLLQGGNPIIGLNNGQYVSTLNQNSLSLAVTPIEQILKFFIGFSNPSDSAYSWNKSLPKSIDMFTSGKLAMYLGRASELFKIESVNPNLSFDVTQILQTKGTNIKRTYGKIYAVSVNKRSTNLTAAFGVAGMLANGEPAKNLSIALSLPPASRALLNTKPADPYLFTFYNSAIISRTWADPDSVASDAIFGELIQNVISNKLSLDDAVNKAQSQMEAIIRK